MCERPSALIHRATFEIKAANLDSHSGTREALKLGDKDQNWLEIEWPVRASHIKVRVIDSKDGTPEEWQARIEAKHPNRQAFYLYCRRVAEKAGWYYVESQEEIDALPAKIAGRLVVEFVKNAKLPKLEASGDIDAGSATSFSAPKLEASGYIYAGSATSANVPPKTLRKVELAPKTVNA